MTDIALYGGPLKKSIILRAYGLCGQSVTEFELSNEEYDLGLSAMNDIAAVFGDLFPFNSPVTGNGSPEEESGIPAGDVLGFSAMLAQEIAPNIGKSYSPNATQASAKTALLAKYRPIPLMEMGRNTPRGSGNRRFFGRTPFFLTDVSADEVAQ